jgi:hypothetical protein
MFKIKEWLTEKYCKYRPATPDMGLLKVFIEGTSDK